MRSKLTTAAGYLAAVAVVFACSAIRVPDEYDLRTCDAEVYGACVVYESAATPRIPQARLESMFRAAAEHWGTTPDAIGGYTVVVKGRDPYDFGGNFIWGVTMPDVRRLDFTVPVPRCLDLVFIHEWGHAGADLMGHDDPRFEDAAIRETLVRLGRATCRA